MHQPRCLRFQYGRAAQLSVLQVGDHELRHVRSSTTQTSRGKRIDYFKGLRIV